MSISAFPLQWPMARPRKAAGLRKTGKFSTTMRTGAMQLVTVAEALERLQREIDMIGARNAVISTNVETRLDGRPRSGQPEPHDPGAALYFDLSGKPHCLPCDTYTKVAQNIAAIAEHMKATRAIERHGVASLAEMFTGFQQLPAPGQAASQHWTKVLGITPGMVLNEDRLSDIYRTLARERASSEPALAELNVARDEARKHIRGGA